MYFSNAKLQNILTIRVYWLIDKFNNPISLLRIKKSSLIVLPLNDQESKLSKLHADHVKRGYRFNIFKWFIKPGFLRDRTVNLSESGLPHKKTASIMKQEKFGSSVNSLSRSEWWSPLFGKG